jgi:hypothetical protein
MLPRPLSLPLDFIATQIPLALEVFGLTIRFRKALSQAFNFFSLQGCGGLPAYPCSVNPQLRVFSGRKPIEHGV